MLTGPNLMLFIPKIIRMASFGIVAELRPEV
jgi:hypothetical protein